jgi:reactive chlorine resistance protein C
MNRQNTPAGNLASAGLWVVRSGLVANLLWIGALKFEDYEVENIEPLVTSSPLFARLHGKLGAARLARLIGVTEIAIGSLIACSTSQIQLQGLTWLVTRRAGTR